MPFHITPRDPSPDLEGSLPQSASGQQASVMDCARTLYRRRATLLWIAFFGIVAATLISVAQPRIYQSQASIQIQGVNDNFLNLRDIYPTAAPSADNAVYVQTQADMLQQDALIEQVVRKLHLEERPEYRSSPSLWDRFRPAGGGVSLSAPAARTAVEEVKQNLQIASSRGSSIIRIVTQARDPQLAADLANTLAHTFIEQSIEARQGAAQQTYASLSRDLEQIRKKVLKSEAELGAYRRGSSSALKREVDGNREFYEAMSRRADEAGVASTVRQSNVRLVGPAEPAAHPYKPNVPLNLLMGMFGGLALAIGYVMLQEQTNSALRSPGEAGAYLTLPELGAIPKAENGRFAALGFPGAGNGKSHVERASLEQPSSGVSESFRATLASILSTSHNGDHPHILVVTSSRPMEGKTTVVSNLGIALAEIGNKVLLIDADLRRPRLHKVFATCCAKKTRSRNFRWKCWSKRPRSPASTCCPAGLPPTTSLAYSAPAEWRDCCRASARSSITYSWTRRHAWSLPTPGSSPGTPRGCCWLCGRITPTERPRRPPCSDSCWTEFL